jgi:hypothetical protein
MKKENKSKLLIIFSFLLLFSAFCLIGTAKLASKQLLHSLSKRDNYNYSDDYVEDNNEIYNIFDNSNQTICKNPTINEFPKDFISFEIYKYPGIF